MICHSNYSISNIQCNPAKRTTEDDNRCGQVSTVEKRRSRSRHVTMTYAGISRLEVNKWMN